MNKIKEALLTRKITIGTWVQINHPAVAEILGNCDYDWIAADCEHTDIDIEGFSQIARGLYGRGPEPFARVRENDVLAIRQVLDAGARGVIVPLVGCAEEAQSAVAAAKFPPEGIRGFSFCRGNNYGIDFDEYACQANQEIAVVVMIESKEAVDNIDEILDVDGVDGVFIGPYDLSGSYGIPGNTYHSLVQEGCRKVLRACQKAEKSAGLHVVIPTSENIEQALNDGFTFIAVGADIVFLDQASRNALDEVMKHKNKVSHHKDSSRVKISQTYKKEWKAEDAKKSNKE
jgi:2-keto-3-deoxy-L-rhamnonate aldolase RhmA